MALRIGRRARSIDRKRPVERPRMPFFVMVRTFLLGSVAIVASAYAIRRHYFIVRPSSLAPASSVEFLEPNSRDFVTAPELLPLPASSR